MALTTPTTAAIKANIIAQLEASFSQTIPLLPKSFMRVLAGILAAVYMTLYKYAGWMFLQMFVKTASYVATTVNGSVITPLIEWGRLIGVGDPVAATQAELVCTVTVENQVGTLPAGTQGIGQNNGVTYITLAAVALSAPTVSVTFRAVNDEQGGGGGGTIGNLNVADIISFANPLANVAKDTVVASVGVTAADAETEAAYRQRVVDRWQKRLQGGAAADYEAWSEEVAGIVNAYPYTSVNPGQVEVYIEATPASSGSPDGIPTTPQLQAVLDNINLDVAGFATRRPVTALANTFAITRTAFNVTVSGITGVDNLAQVQSDITDALTEYFLAREPYISGLAVPPRKDIISSTAVNGVVDDVVSAAGGLFTGAVTKEGAATISQRALGQGEKSKLTIPVIWA